MLSKKQVSDNQIAFYQTPDGAINVEVLYANENIWLSQKKMAQLFDCSPDNISLHLKKVYQEHELEKESTIEEYSVVQKEGNRDVKRNITMYSLEAIIAVGYRVNSERGTQLSDLTAYPLANYILYPNRENLAFRVIEPKLYRQFESGDYLGYGLKLFP